jgi:hypothetical protein
MTAKGDRMTRRICIPIATLALVFGAVLAGATAAAASPVHGQPASVHAYKPGGLMVRPSGVSDAVTHHGHFTTAESTNWSGYAVTGANAAFTSVSASWTQPAVTCTSSGKRHSATYSSFWAGLDGYSSNSVEQTGTDSDCNGSTPTYYGWYEMYPAYPVNFTNPVRPGDSFSASVTFSGTETYTLVLTDHTQNWTQTIVQNSAGDARSSAEVITEAPSSGSVLPLADFGTVKYSASAANGTSLGTQNPIQIIMVNNKGAQKDSTSAISSAGAFSNTWISST